MVKNILVLFGTIFCVIAVPLFLAGLTAFISPSMFFSLLSKLPVDVQAIIVGDAFLGSFPRSWAYMIGAVVLWIIGSYIRR